MTLDALFRPYRLTPRLTLPNRIVLAPCTRNRATADLSPTPGAARHYGERADAGLLITEAVLILPGIQGFIDTPGIFLDSHQRAWAGVADAVHDRGGRIFLQLWHPGRMSHSHFAGTAPRSASDVLDPARRRQVGGLELYHERPWPLSGAEIGAVIAAYAAAARRAIAAGFDGVEIHAANGYLPEQFWRAHTNRRTDAWGGTAAGRARFTIEVAGACAQAVGAGRVGIRLSPAAYFSEMKYSEGDNDALDLILSKLSECGLAYVHTGVVTDDPVGYLGGTSTAYLRRRWAGTLIGNGGYTPEFAAEGIDRGDFDLAAFGKLFLANPDLVARLSAGADLAPYSRAVLDGFE